MAIDIQKPKCLGLIGGLSPEASTIYTRLIHEEVRIRKGQGHSANLRCALLDRQDLAAHFAKREWTRLAGKLDEAARALVNAGAQALLFDSSALHVAAESVEVATGVPLLHVIESCEGALTEAKMRCVGLLGTRCVEEERLWRDRLDEHCHIDIALPSKGDRDLVLKIMDLELARGRIKEASRVTMIRTMKALQRTGARAVVVVAPELLSIAFASDTTLRFYAAARLHARAAVQWAFATVPQAA